jgi:putative transposase
MTMNHFKGKQFQQDVIIVAVGYYLRYNLSYREVQEILYDRGINVSHTTIYRWVQEYGKLLYQIWKKKNLKILLFMENGIICIEPSMQMV